MTVQRGMTVASGSGCQTAPTTRPSSIVEQIEAARAGSRRELRQQEHRCEIGHFGWVRIATGDVTARCASTAPSCSTRTLVVSPAIEITGRNEAGRALLDVGATRITDRGSIESACTITPKRSPCCSCPTPFGTPVPPRPTAQRGSRRTGSDQSLPEFGARAGSHRRVEPRPPLP